MQCLKFVFLFAFGAAIATTAIVTANREFLTALFRDRFLQPDGISAQERDRLCVDEAKRQFSMFRYLVKTHLGPNDGFGLPALNNFTTYWKFKSDIPDQITSSIIRSEAGSEPVRVLREIRTRSYGAIQEPLWSFAYLDSQAMQAMQRDLPTGQYPVAGESAISQGPRIDNPGWYERLYYKGSHWHSPGSYQAIDIAAPLGAPVIAFKPGIVVWVEDGHGDYACGRTDHVAQENSMRILQPDGMETMYVHLKLGSIRVAVGDEVSEGQELAAVGSSGTANHAHLHFQVGGLTDGGYRGMPVRFYRHRGETPWAPEINDKVAL